MQLDATKLPLKQIRAIEALLREPGLDAAAKTAGINSSTLWRWLQQPAFSAAYRDARSRLLEQTITALQSGSVQAVTVLLDVMNDTDTPAATRVSAARTILEFAIKSREHLEFEDRLRALELATESRYVLRTQADPA